MKSDRLTYRKIDQTVKGNILRWYTDKKIMKFIKGRAMTQAEAEDRFNFIVKTNRLNPQMGFWAVYKHNTFIGIAKLTYLKANVLEIGYGLLEQYWRQGFANEIINTLLKVARNIDSAKLITGIVNKENHASVALLKKHGFEFISEVNEGDLVQQHYSRKP